MPNSLFILPQLLWGGGRRLNNTQDGVANAGIKGFGGILGL